jgi:hypothetical protein
MVADQIKNLAAELTYPYVTNSGPTRQTPAGHDGHWVWTAAGATDISG